MTSEENIRQILTLVGLSTNGASCTAIYESYLGRMLTDLFSRTRGKHKAECLISSTATNGNRDAQVN